MSQLVPLQRGSQQAEDDTSEAREADWVGGAGPDQEPAGQHPGRVEGGGSVGEGGLRGCPVIFTFLWDVLEKKRCKT